METSKQKFVIIVPDGTNLYRENPKSKTEEDNTIRKLPVGTSLTLESEVANTHDSEDYVFVTHVAGGEEAGWVSRDSVIQEDAGNKYVVKNLEGVDLRMEPNMHSKTMEGEENVVTSLPFLTVVSGVIPYPLYIDEQLWLLVHLENGSQDKIGWVDFDFLVNQNRKSKVIASQGTDLRREPTPEDKTEDGNDNVICSLPVDTNLLLVDVKRYDDGSFWFFVSPEIDNNDEVGWVVMEDIEAPPFGGDNQGHPEATYTFTYDKKERIITKSNLDTALSDTYKYLSTTKVLKSQFSIELQRNLPSPDNKKSTYWTTEANLKNVTVTPKIN